MTLTLVSFAVSRKAYTRVSSRQKTLQKACFCMLGTTLVPVDMPPHAVRWNEMAPHSIKMEYVTMGLPLCPADRVAVFKGV